jgi:serine/alanine adding enzyme
MGIRLFKEEDKERWDRYVMEARDSVSYHLIGWKAVIEKSFGHKTYYLLSEDKQRQVNGILPLVCLKSLLFGKYMVSIPFVNYGGICAETEGIEEELLNGAIHLAKQEGVDHIELRHTRNTWSGLPVKTAKASMRLSLPPKEEELWSSFSSKLRSQIRKPIKEGMVSKFGKEEELDSFYSVFSVNMRDLGTPVYSKTFFRNILREFKERAWICSVYTREGDPAASGFLLEFKKRLEIPWASSIRRYNSLSPNMLLYWSVLKFGCDMGCSLFDFGRSTIDEGTYKFKEQWGAKPTQLYWHYWLRNGNSLPDLSPDNPKYRLAIRLWKKLPVTLTRWIGPGIVKNLP